MKNILGLLVLPFAMTIVALGLIILQVKFFMELRK